MTDPRPSLLILCHHPELRSGPCMVTFRAVFLGEAETCAASGRSDIAYAHLDGWRSLPGIVRSARARPGAVLLFSSVNALRKSPALWLLALNVWFLKRKQVLLWHEAASVVRVTAGWDGPSRGRRLLRRAHFAAARHFLKNGLTWHLAVSMQAKQLVLFLLGVPPDRVLVTGNVIAVDKCPIRDRAQDRAELRLCMAGDPTWHKGFDLFLSLARGFREWRGRPVRYTWYGGTPEWIEQIRKDDRGAKVAEAGVRLAGHRAPLSQALAEEDLFVFVSRCDGFGLAALEALACDLPVFSFDSSGIAELLPAEFVCSRLEDMREQVQAYLENRDRYPPGFFREIAERCGPRFLKAWRNLERAMGFEQGLRASKGREQTCGIEQKKTKETERK